MYKIFVTWLHRCEGKRRKKKIKKEKKRSKADLTTVRQYLRIFLMYAYMKCMDNKNIVRDQKIILIDSKLNVLTIIYSILFVLHLI